MSKKGQPVRIPPDAYELMKQKAEAENRNIGQQIAWELERAGVLPSKTRSKK